ncbi:MAG: YdcF family protein [Cyanobacteria bacterium Co-bin8]|nr:YdcF family protein [Cyanobacteria bacterium Co-bin8]
MWRKFGESQRLRLAILAGCGLAGWLTLLGLDIYAFSLKSDSSPADAAIVLGAAVWDEQPSPVFAERINHAVHLYQAGTVRLVIFTGGVGANDQFAESIVASRYAIARGVAAEDTVCETTSKITWENLQGAKQIIDQQQLGRVLIVSDPLHLRRSVTMARELGIDAYSAPTPTTRYTGLQSQLEFLLREVFFYGLYWVQRPFRLIAKPAPEIKVQPCQAIEQSRLPLPSIVNYAAKRFRTDVTGVDKLGDTPNRVGQD